MKTKTKKCIALVCAASCCLIGGSFALQNQVAEAAVSYENKTLTISSFKMAEGASVRISANKQYANNGIRFSATMSPSDYNSLTTQFAEGDIETGTFIMPYQYYVNDAFSYDNCFDETPKYVWGDVTVGENQLKIQHIEGELYATKDDDGNDVYQLNGSIVNMLNENLNVQLVGVSYVKATLNGNTYYAFAESDFAANKRSIVDVSQNGIEKQGENGANADTFEGYITQYINYYQTKNGVLPTANYTQEVYVKTSKGFEKDEELTKVESADLSVYNTVVGETGEAPEIAGYTYCSGLAKEGYGDGKETDMLKVNGSTTLKYYYEQDRDNVIWSVDKHNNAKVHPAGLGGGEYYTAAQYAVDGFTGYTASMKVDTNAYSYQGERSVTIAKGPWNDWFEVQFPHNVSVPQTNKLSLTISNLSNVDFTNFQFRIFYGNGTQNWSTNATADAPMTIPANTYAQKYVFNFDKNFTDVWKIFFFQPADDNLKLLLHDIRYENDFYGANVSVPTADTTAVEFKASDVIKSTVYTDKEIDKATVSSLTYKDLSNSANRFKTEWGFTKAEAQGLTANNGVYTATVANNTTYSVDATIELDGKTATTSSFIVGHYDMMYATFEEDNSTSGYSGLYGDWGEVALDQNFTYDAPNSETHSADNATTTANEFNSKTMLSTSHGGILGDTSLIIKPEGTLSEKIWQGIRSSKNDRVSFTGENGATKSFNTLCFFVYLPTYDYTGLSYNTDVGGYVALTHMNVYLHGGSRGGVVNPETQCLLVYMQNMYVNFKPGWNYCEIPLQMDEWGYYNFTGISGITFYNGAASQMTIAIDNIALKAHA